MKTTLFWLLSLSLASATQSVDIESLRHPSGLSSALHQAEPTGRIEASINQGVFHLIQSATEETQEG
jgi:hypothetical protein